MALSHSKSYTLLHKRYCCLCETEGDLRGAIIGKRTSLLAQTVKPLSTMRETRIPSLGREDPLEKEMAAYSSILAWKIPRTEESCRLKSMGSLWVGHDRGTSLSLSIIGKRHSWEGTWGGRSRGIPQRSGIWTELWRIT